VRFIEYKKNIFWV